MRPENGWKTEARNTQTVEQLKELAKQNGLEMTDEEATAYFEMAHRERRTMELADEELENIAAGGCTQEGRPITVVWESCNGWACKHCHKWPEGKKHHCKVKNQEIAMKCKNCDFCIYKKGVWSCNGKNDGVQEIETRP